MIWQKKAQHEDDEPASGSWKDTGLAITFFLSLLITIENLTKRARAWSREEKFPNSISVGMKKAKYEKSNDYAGWDCQNDPKKISSVVREGLTLRRRMTEQNISQYVRVRVILTKEHF